MFAYAYPRSLAPHRNDVSGFRRRCFCVLPGSCPQLISSEDTCLPLCVPGSLYDAPDLGATQGPEER